MDALIPRLLTDGGLSLALLASAVVYLWRELKACKDNHLDCERKNLVLANAIDDLADGKGYEAKAKAQTIINTAKGHGE